MNTYITLIIGLVSFSIFGQTQYEIKGFSDKYMGVLIIDKGYEEEVFKKGQISITDTRTNKEIIKISSDELTFDLDKNGNVKTNIIEVPYGEQSIIIYEDFNFDGKKDLAVMDGQYSCYHGPSFQVYLEIDNTLKHSPEFTRLAQEYCGMFQVDYETQTIHTMTKSGCCWHQFSKFKVVDNIPKPILVIEEDATNFPFLSTTTIEWNGNKKSENVEKTIDLKHEDITEILSFTLTKSKKKVVVFSMDKSVLNYILIRPDSTIEFSYPTETTNKNPNFTINKERNTLIFKNKNATYKIYEASGQNKLQKIGILVEVNGKKYDLTGDIHSAKGRLKDIKTIQFENVVSQ